MADSRLGSRRSRTCCRFASCVGSTFRSIPACTFRAVSELSAAQRARAAWLWSRRRGVIAGLSAAAMLGAKWIEPGLPAELVHTNRRQPPMLIVHTDDVAAGETQRVDGMAVTTAARTAFDIGRRVALESGRPACRCADECHRRQGQRYRVGRRAASWCAWPDTAPSDARARRRRRRVAVRIADSTVVRASRVPATGNADTRPRRVRRSRSPSSIWAGASTSSAWTSRAHITGPIPGSGAGMSSATRGYPSSVGLISG